MRLEDIHPDTEGICCGPSLIKASTFDDDGIELVAAGECVVCSSLWSWSDQAGWQQSQESTPDLECRADFDGLLTPPPEADELARNPTSLEELLAEAPHDDAWRERFRAAMPSTEVYALAGGGYAMSGDPWTTEPALVYFAWTRQEWAHVALWKDPTWFQRDYAPLRVPLDELIQDATDALEVDGIRFNPDLPLTSLVRLRES